MPSWTGGEDEPFHPRTTPASPDPGVLADTFWRLSGVERRDHCFAFAAAGPRAPTIISDPLPIPPHIRESPVGRVYYLDGQVLLLGAGHDADTVLHLAELIAGVPYRLSKHVTVLRDGQSVRLDYYENVHCCERFSRADEWLRSQGPQHEGHVGNARARLARARDIVQVAVDHLTQDPSYSSHPESAGVPSATRRERASPADVIYKLVSSDRSQG